MRVHGEVRPATGFDTLKLQFQVTLPFLVLLRWLLDSSLDRNGERRFKWRRWWCANGPLYVVRHKSPGVKMTSNMFLDAMAVTKAKLVDSVLPGWFGSFDVVLIVPALHVRTLRLGPRACRGTVVSGGEARVDAGVGVVDQTPVFGSFSFELLSCSKLKRLTWSELLAGQRKMIRYREVRTHEKAIIVLRCYRSQKIRSVSSELRLQTTYGDICLRLTEHRCHTGAGVSS